MLISPITLLRIFTSDNSEVIQAGLDRLYIVVPLYFLCGFMDVLCATLRGMGKSLESMIVALVTCCFFRVVWVNTVFILSPSVKTIFVVYPITWGLAIVVYLMILIPHMRKLLKSVNGHSELVLTK